jgi:UDP-glucose 4-epimerase
MKILVIGGSGFLGSHVADELTNLGHEVTIFDHTKSKYIQENQKMVIGEITDYDSIEKIISKNQIVYHFAGIASILDASNDPINTVKNNILATTYILEACKSNKIKRFIFASSIYVYSDLGSFYRTSKQSSELLIENYNKIYKLDFTVLRFGALYGRRANNFNFIGNAVKQALLTKKIFREGTGEGIRDYIHVKDAAIASAMAMTEKYLNSYIMVSGNQTVRVKDILNMINEILNNEIKIIYTNPKEEDHYEITPYTFRPRLAKKILLNEYHELGQGILDCIYDTYKHIGSTKEKDNLKIELPASIHLP